MEFTKNELTILERLLQNRINADYDPDVAALHQKVKQALDTPKSNAHVSFPTSAAAPIRGNY